MSRETAESIAVAGLALLAEEPDALGRFLALTGLGPMDLRAAAGEPGFLAGVLEFYMADESLLLVLAERIAERPTMIAVARNLLSGLADED